MIDPFWDNWRAGFASGVSLTLLIELVGDLSGAAMSHWELILSWRGSHFVDRWDSDTEVTCREQTVDDWCCFFTPDEWAILVGG